MSAKAFSIILERLRGYGSWLYFHLKGEPLLHPELGSLLKIAEEAGFEVTLTTNGTLVEQRAPLLFAAPNLHRLNISLQSQAATDMAVASSPYWAALARFLDLHREALRSGTVSLPLSLRLWNLEDGRLPDSMKPAWDFLAARYPGLGGIPGAAAFIPDEGTGRRGAGSNGIRLDDHVYLNCDELFSWPDPTLPFINSQGFCYALRNQIGILVDGTVVPCCLDGEGRMALGNILEEPLDAVLNSDRARGIYNGFSGRRLAEALCRTCGYLNKRLN